MTLRVAPTERGILRSSSASRTRATRGLLLKWAPPAACWIVLSSIGIHSNHQQRGSPSGLVTRDVVVELKVGAKNGLTYSLTHGDMPELVPGDVVKIVGIEGHDRTWILETWKRDWESRSTREDGKDTIETITHIPTEDSISARLGEQIAITVTVPGGLPFVVRPEAAVHDFPVLMKGGRLAVEGLVKSREPNPRPSDPSAQPKGPPQMVHSASGELWFRLRLRILRRSQ